MSIVVVGWRAVTLNGHNIPGTVRGLSLAAFTSAWVAIRRYPLQRSVDRSVHAAVRGGERQDIILDSAAKA